MTPTPTVPRATPAPATSGDSGPQRTEGAERQVFERLLTDRAPRDGRTTEDEMPAPGLADWGLRPVWPTPTPHDEQRPADIAAMPAHAGMNPAPTADPAGMPVVMPAVMPVVPSGLYTHLALPHAVPADAGRFEVLGGSMVTEVTIGAHAQGGMTVTVGSAVQHALLLERHLPLLQRRVAEKVAAHVRVQDRPARDR